MKKNIIDVSKLDMSKLKSIKNDEINELIPLAQSGDESAREKLIYGNLKFVLSVVKKFNETETKFNDLFQVGCIGLLKSIDGYCTITNLEYFEQEQPVYNFTVENCHNYYVGENSILAHNAIS